MKSAGSNRFGVAKRMWRKWSRAQKAMFNETMDALKDQSLFAGSAELTMPTKAWRVLRWNIAFILACNAPKGSK